ncbi:MAG: hypothetical protein CFE45_43390 [Burkholderiales bacterium PBB5]|nr:MAG: hypothetical protein CFE45_43390 [Burkholderiales bacterium PBB5]
MDAPIGIGPQRARQGCGRVGVDVEEAPQLRLRRADLEVVDEAWCIGSVEQHDAGLTFMHVAPRQHARPGTTRL